MLPSPSATSDELMYGWPQMPVPGAVTEAAAAQAYINPVTAYQLLEEAQIPRGQWLLQSAASSTIGKLLVQMARHKGIKVISVVRSPHAEKELRDLGRATSSCMLHGCSYANRRAFGKTIMR